jgi:hypothetical protein
VVVIIIVIIIVVPPAAPGIVRRMDMVVVVAAVTIGAVIIVAAAEEPVDEPAQTGAALAPVVVAVAVKDIKEVVEHEKDTFRSMAGQTRLIPADAGRARVLPDERGASSPRPPRRSPRVLTTVHRPGVGARVTPPVLRP